MTTFRFSLGRLYTLCSLSVPYPPWVIESHADAGPKQQDILWLSRTVFTTAPESLTPPAHEIPDRKRVKDKGRAEHFVFLTR